MTSPTVAILLATHNGEAYLDQQLESLVAQELTNWVVLVRDDCSSDSTPEHLARWVKRDHRISMLPGDNTPTGSASRNFSKLLEAALHCDAEFFCFCDQDDVWLPRKLSELVDELKHLQSGNDGVMRPALVHSDLEVVDADLNPIHPSFVERMGLKPGTQANACRLLSKNEVTGCAAMFNRPLLELVVPVPEQVIMHDWWMAVIAAYLGAVRFVPSPLVQYRQHAANVLGAKTIWHGLNPLTNWRAGWRRGNREYLRTVDQARELYSHLESLAAVSDQDIDEIRQYSQIASMNRHDRLRTASRLSMWHGKRVLDCVLAARLLLLPRNGS